MMIIDTKDFSEHLKKSSLTAAVNRPLSGLDMTEIPLIVWCEMLLTVPKLVPQLATPTTLKNNRDTCNVRQQASTLTCSIHLTMRSRYTRSKLHTI
jgi:hypothetical protein